MRVRSIMGELRIPLQLAPGLALLMLDTVALGQPGALQWSELAPPAHAEHVSVFDSRHRRLVVFGGRVGGLRHDDGDHTNDVWVFHLEPKPRWERLVPLGQPPSARSGCAAVFDPHGMRMLVFGGRDASGLRNDLWELALAGRPRWRQLQYTGPAPSPRHRHAATLDPTSNRVLVSGGWDGRFLNDVWQLTLDGRPAWSLVSAEGPGPSPRASHVAVLVPEMGLAIFGGAGPVRCPTPNTCTQQSNDVWLLSLGPQPRWIDLTPRIAGPRPCGIQAHAAVFDPAHSNMIVIGGYAEYPYAEPCGRTIAEAWSLSFESLTWTRVGHGPEQPRARRFASAVLDREKGRLLVYGGTWGRPFADVWALTLDGAPTWARVSPTREIPPDPTWDGWGAPSRVLLSYDHHLDRIVTYRGQQVWSYSFRDHEGWTAVDAAGEAPTSRLEAAEVYDPVRSRVIVHGGRNHQGVLSDTWELSLSDPPTWTRLPVRGEAPARFNAAASYDPIRSRMVLTGGYGRGPYTPTGDAWALSLEGNVEWTLLSTSGPTRAGHSSIYDPVNDRVVVYGGGWDGWDSWYTFNQTWALSLSDGSAWRQLHAGGFAPDLPLRRGFAALTHDPVGDRMILVGGLVPGAFPKGPFGDAWEFRFKESRWSPIDVPAAHPLWESPAAVYDSRRDRLVLAEYDWLWSLELNNTRPPSATRSFPRERARPTGADGLGASDLGLSVRGPNPFRERLAVDVSLPENSPCRLEVFDVSGRRVRVTELRFPAKGTHRVEFEDVGRFPAGLYVLRLTQGMASRTIRLVHSR